MKIPTGICPPACLPPFLSLPGSYHSQTHLPPSPTRPHPSNHRRRHSQLSCPSPSFNPPFLSKLCTPYHPAFGGRGGTLMLSVRRKKRRKRWKKRISYTIQEHQTRTGFIIKQDILPSPPPKTDTARSCPGTNPIRIHDPAGGRGDCGQPREAMGGGVS